METPKSEVLGSADFVKEIKEGIIEGKKASRDLPALKALCSKPAIEDIIKSVDSAFIQHPALVKNVSLSMSQTHCQ